MSLNSTSLQLDIVSNVIDTKVCLYPLGPDYVPHCLPCEYTLQNNFYQVYFALVLYFVFTIMPPRPAKRRNRPVSLNPKTMSLQELNALPRNSLILLASARNLVTTGTKTRLAQRVFEHEQAGTHAPQRETPTALNENPLDVGRPQPPDRQQMPSVSTFSPDQLLQLREIIAEVVAPQRSDQIAGLPQDIPLLSPASVLNSGPATGLNAPNALPNTSNATSGEFQDGGLSQPQLVPSLLPTALPGSLGVPVHQPPHESTLPPLPEKIRTKITKHHAVPPPRPNSRCGTNSCSQVSTDPLAHRLAFLQSQAIANSTRRSYQAGIRRYSAFCTSKGWQCFPATENTLRFFAAYLADQVSFKTIKLYLAGIRFAHTENSLPDPFQEAPLLHLLLRGIKRTVGLSSRQRLPITMSLLRQIKEELARASDLLPSDKLMLWSAFTLAFYGFLRSSEFTAPSATQFNPLVHLSNSDVSFNSGGCLTLHLKSSKTDPYRQGCTLLIAPSHRSVCAVRALKSTSPRVPSTALPRFTYSSLETTSPGLKSPPSFVLFSNVSEYQQSSTHPTASGSVPQLLQQKLACRLGLSRH